MEVSIPGATSAEEDGMLLGGSGGISAGPAFTVASAAVEAKLGSMVPEDAGDGATAIGISSEDSSTTACGESEGWCCSCDDNEAAAAAAATTTCSAVSTDLRGSSLGACSMSETAAPSILFLLLLLLKLGRV